MYDMCFYKFTATIKLSEAKKSVEEGIVYSTKGYADALDKVIKRLVDNESNLVSIDSFYPIESSGDVLDMYDLVQMIKDYKGDSKD